MGGDRIREHDDRSAIDPTSFDIDQSSGRVAIVKCGASMLALWGRCVGQVSSCRRSVRTSMRRSAHTVFGLLAAVAIVAFAVGSAPSRPVPAMLGVPTIVLTEPSDTLLDIARFYDVGFVEIREANPDIDPSMPGAASRCVCGRNMFCPKRFVRASSSILPSSASIVLSGTDVHNRLYPEDIEALPACAEWNDGHGKAAGTKRDV